MQNSDLELPVASMANASVGAFVPYPAFLMAGLSWEQFWRQQQMYQRAWAAIYGPHQVRVRVAELPRVLRN